MNELPKPPKLPGGRRHDEVFNPRKLFVGGLSKETTQKQFRAYWEQWGELEDCVVMIDPHTQKSRGFGFVVFVSQQIASEILSRGESLTMYGRTLDIKKAVPRSAQSHSTHGHPSIASTNAHAVHHSYNRHPSAHPSASYYPPHPMYPPHPTSRAYAPYTMPNHNVSSVPRMHRGYEGSRDRDSVRRHSRRTRHRKRSDKLFIGGLAETFTDRTLHSYFGKYGSVQDAVVMFDKEGNSRRFGFVTFVNPDHVDLVLNEGKHAINGVNVTIERAIPKDQLNGRERVNHFNRDHDRYSSRYEDPYYSRTRAPPYYGHKGPPPPPPPPMYSPPGAPTHHGQYPPRMSPHAVPPHPGYLAPPVYPYPPAYYPPHPPAAAANTIAPPSPSKTAQPVRYHYSYPQPSDTASDAKQSLSVKPEDKQGNTAHKAMNAVQDTKVNSIPPVPPVYGGAYPAQTYAEGMAAARPPIHAPTPNHSYHAAYPNVAYGGTRGGVQARRTYRPY